MWMLKIYKFIMKSTPKYRWIHQWSNKWQFLLLEYELEKGAEVSQIIWVRTQISCLSTYSNIWWRWLEAEIIDLSIFSELRLSFVLNYVWWRRGLTTIGEGGLVSIRLKKNSEGDGFFTSGPFNLIT